MSIEIPLKDGKVELREETIVLSESQIKKILDESKLKTRKEWQTAEHGIKIPLTEEQMDQIISVKNEIVGDLNALELIESDFIDIIPHAMKRAIERLEGLPVEEPYNLAMRRETYEKIAQALIDSKEVEDKAEWKGGSYLRYNFKSQIDENDIVITVSFEETILVITVIVTKRKGFFFHEHTDFAKLKKLF